MELNESENAYTIVASWTALPDKGEQVAMALKEMAINSRTEPGCRLYQPIRSVETPDQFMIFESYDSKEAFEEHRNSDHFIRLVLNEALAMLKDRSLAEWHAV